MFCQTTLKAYQLMPLFQSILSSSGKFFKLRMFLKKKILERWAEYIRELFEDNRKEHDVMKKNFAGPPIMKDEVREAMRKMKTGKATGPDGLSIELIEALEEYGIEKVTTLLNEIYDTGQIPVDMSRSIFIALPKKPEATECELHRTISLMSHVTKLLDESKKHNKSRNSRRTIRFCGRKRNK